MCKGRKALPLEREKCDTVDSKKIRWKKRSILWELPCWIDLAVRHSIYVMHVKKNVCGSLLGTLMNDKGKTKDHVRAQDDMEHMDIRPELCHDGTSARLQASAVNLTKKEK